MKAALLAMALAAQPTPPGYVPIDTALYPQDAVVLPPEPLAEAEPACGSPRPSRLSPGQTKAAKAVVAAYRIANPSLVRVGFACRAVKLRFITGKELVSIPLPGHKAAERPSVRRELAPADGAHPGGS